MMADLSARLAAARPHLPAGILGLFVVLSVAIWLPGRAASVGPDTSNAVQLEQRLETGRERIAALMPVTHDRPVFHASRKPVAAPEAPVAPEPVLRLLGVLSDEGEKVALVRISTSASLHRISAGQTIGQWRILEIGTHEIRVSKDGAPAVTLTIGG